MNQWELGEQCANIDNAHLYPEGGYPEGIVGVPGVGGRKHRRK